MIGVYVGFHDPLYGELPLAHEIDNALGAGVANAPGGVVEIEHRIDDAAGATGRVLDDVAEGVGRRVEKGGHDRFQGFVVDDLHNLSPVSCFDVTGTEECSDNKRRNRLLI